MNKKLINNYYTNVEELKHLEEKETYDGEKAQFKEIEDMNKFVDGDSVKLLSIKWKKGQYQKIFNKNKTN